jgi:hypothetical protein
LEETWRPMTGWYGSTGEESRVLLKIALIPTRNADDMVKN